MGIVSTKLVQHLHLIVLLFFLALKLAKAEEKCIYKRFFSVQKDNSSILSNTTTIPSCMGKIVKVDICHIFNTSIIDRNNVTYQLLILDENFGTVHRVNISLDCDPLNRAHDHCCNTAAANNNIGVDLNQPFIGLMAPNNSEKRYLFYRIQAIVITVLADDSTSHSYKTLVVYIVVPVGALLIALLLIVCFACLMKARIHKSHSDSLATFFHSKDQGSNYITNRDDESNHYYTYIDGNYVQEPVSACPNSSCEVYENIFNLPEIQERYEMLTDYDTEEGYENLFHMPERRESALHDQVKKLRVISIRDEQIKTLSYLGSGQFGQVYKGVWSSHRGDVEVAIKTLREDAKDEERVKFLQEAAIMGQFKHSSVVTMHGMVTDKQPVRIVLELFTKGDLRTHLNHAKAESLNDVINSHTLLSYCRQVAAGMSYLANKNFIHRDLAARNILVSDDDICKIADFGMSRDLMYEDMYKAHGGLIPVKWTAPEALYYKVYSMATDVWSYGIVLYEIWSVGHKPYEDLDNAKVLRFLQTGSRLPPPPGCPRAIYSIMMDCWNPNIQDRPTFEVISQTLSASDLKLLKWSEMDTSAASPEAMKLGASLSSANNLYIELQKKYYIQKDD